MITFTTAKPLPANWTRWEVDDWEAHEKTGWGIATVIMHSPLATDYRVTKTVVIRNSPASGPTSFNGPSDKVGYLAVVGGAIDNQLVVTLGGINLVTGFDDAHNAYVGAAGGRNARLAALATWMLANGVADATMAGA